MRPLRWRSLWLSIGILLASLVVYFCLEPGGTAPQWALYSDKLDHAVSYFALAGWFGCLIQRRFWLRLVVALLAFGGAIEIAQALMPFGRQADLADMLANTVGMAAGLLACFWFGERWLTEIDRRLGAR
jgi:VanZ family protein